MTHALSIFLYQRCRSQPELVNILQAFQKSQDPNKMNLGVGAYRDDQVR